MALVPLPVLAASDMRPPVEGDALPVKPKRLNGTGGTGDGNDTALTIGAMATILVGAVAVRARWGSTQALAEDTATTDPILPAYGRFDWLVSADDCYVGVEAADGSSAYEAHVWTSSGQRSGSSG